jgi:hypothetical protein
MYILNSPPVSDFGALGYDSEVIRSWLAPTDEAQKERRSRMYREYPVLVPSLLDRDDVLSSDLVCLIDKGILPTEAIARTYAIKATSVKPLRGLSPGKLQPWLNDPLYLLLALDAVAAIRCPVTDEDWEVFTQVAWALSPIWPHTLSEHVLQEFSKEGFQKSIDRLGRSVERWKTGLSSVFQYEYAVSRWSHWVAPHAQDSASSIATEHLRQQSIIETVQQSLAWRAAECSHRMKHVAESSCGEMLNWPILREPFAFGRIEITCCESAQDFVRLNTELDATLHDELESCANGSVNAVFTRNIDTGEKTLALVHLTKHEEGPIFAYANTHHGYGMRYPYQDEVDAMDAMLESLLESQRQEWLNTLAGTRDAPSRWSGIREFFDALEEPVGNDQDRLLSPIVPEFEALRQRLSALPSPP